MPEPRSQQIVDALQTFFSTPLEALLKQRAEANAETEILEFFYRVAATVPAYQAFLQEQGIDPIDVKGFEDFQQLPLTTKQNYLQRYSLAQLCRDGKLESCDMIAVSSGSTGQPSFWLRSLTDELQIATRFEQVFYDSFKADQRRTLAVICFALGTWVGGMYTADCCRHLASKGYPITVITPGNNKTEIFRVIQALAPGFEQTVLLGYPPFLKDVVDTGIAQGIDWKQYHIKWVMAGEVFSEEWRSLVGDRVGSANPCYDSASLYGTADAGVLGNETPLSICIRRWLANHPEIARQLFGESRLPTLVQYDPCVRFFEEQEGTLLFSGDNGIPLIRYHISDNGGIISYDEMLQFLADQGFDPIETLQETSWGQGDTETRGHGDAQRKAEEQGAGSREQGAGEDREDSDIQHSKLKTQNSPPPRGIHPLPFVYVFGRSHFTVSYFGANIYPENVTVGLEQTPICDWVTGKFVMQVKEDADRNQYLSIVVELAPGVEGNDAKREAIANAIHHHLCRLNSEFANYIPAINQVPEITLTPPGDPEYFPVGVKHRYTRQ
ncbi:phenylacetate--CoA ligase family protein [Kovacikia minuta CCNUW1]|uniref:phenylacetate--CoA ligase family protein n=1 Tax=Kovacikia minuta TaxID=2931930 RepID=UPI001CCB6CAC|nr:phenylacetate--CoA ligase family protein [Kovacikia minuta]UBF27509.1 phenylacetate--CoA ligase family protein [Kovacikia minuta CCNUW1]